MPPVQENPRYPPSLSTDSEVDLFLKVNNIAMGLCDISPQSALQHGSPTILIDSETFSSLLATADDLRAELKLSKSNAAAFSDRILSLTNALASSNDRLSKFKTSYKMVCENNNIEFAFFPLLPREIRTMIWSLALRWPRVVQIRYICVPKRYPDLDARSSTPSHPLLQVDRLARSEALKVLHPYKSKIPADAQRFYINPKIDTLWFTQTEFWNSIWSLPSNDLPRRVGLPGVALSVMNLLVLLSGDNIARTMEVLKKCFNGGIKTLKVVISANVNCKSSSVRLTEPQATPQQILLSGTLFQKFAEATEHTVGINMAGLTSWTKLGADVSEHFEQLRDSECKKKQDMMRFYGWTEDMFKLPGTSWPQFQFCEGWTPPMFEFVEATEA